MGKKRAKSAEVEVLVDEEERYELAGDPVESDEPEDDREVVELLAADLESLEEADELLTKIEQAESACDEAMIVVENARENLKAAKGQYAAAVGRLRRLCRARREDHPLFDQPSDQEPEVPECKNPRDLVKVAVIDGEHKGTIAPIWCIGEESVSILVAGRTEEIPIGGYETDELGMRLIKEARDEGILNSVNGWESLLRMHWREAATAAASDKDAWKTLPICELDIKGNVERLLEEKGIDTLGKLSDLMAKHGQWWNKEVKGIGETGAADVADRFADFWTKHPEYCAA